MILQKKNQIKKDINIELFSKQKEKKRSSLLFKKYKLESQTKKNLHKNAFKLKQKTEKKNNFQNFRLNKN